MSHTTISPKGLMIRGYSLSSSKSLVDWVTMPLEGLRNRGEEENTHPDDDEARFKERTAWILLLLYTPDDNGESKPIYGKTRIMEILFLLSRKLEEHFELETEFEFTPETYGPVDENIPEILGELASEGQITIRSNESHQSKYRGEEYRLTEAGKEQAEKLYSVLSENQIKLLKWVKYQHATQPVGKLLTYIYGEYPEMMESDND